jgi:hypothetical protein
MRRDRIEKVAHYVNKPQYKGGTPIRANCLKTQARAADIMSSRLFRVSHSASRLSLLASVPKRGRRYLLAHIAY